MFTEAHSKKFNITSMQMFGEGIMDDESVKDINSTTNHFLSNSFYVNFVCKKEK